MITIAVAMACALIVFGDWNTAVWAKSGETSRLVAASLSIALGCGLYFPIIKHGGFTRIVAMGSAMTSLGGLFVGYFLVGEEISTRTALGAVLGVVAVLLLA